MGQIVCNHPYGYCPTGGYLHVPGSQKTYVPACARGTPSQALWVFLWCWFRSWGLWIETRFICGVDAQDTVNPLSLLHPPTGSTYKEIGHLAVVVLPWMWWSPFPSDIFLVLSLLSSFPPFEPEHPNNRSTVTCTLIHPYLPIPGPYPSP